jgi:hypothetical protein
MKAKATPVMKRWLYAIESPKNGIKGILVSGFGVSSGRRAQSLIASLQIRQE